MFIVGGEPPHVEEPEPRFGKVITTLNKIAYAMEQRSVGYNEGIHTKIAEMNGELDALVNEVLLPIDAHIASRGAVHGEHKGTVGLSKKDNLRTATLGEMIGLLPVDAFVTPQGSYQALLANNASFDINQYQRNDSFAFASYFFPDEYPVVVPTQLDPTRYFNSSFKPGMLLNGDRLVISPVSDVGMYSRQTIFASLPVGRAKSSQLAEVPNLNVSYRSVGWNAVAGEASDGSVAFFRPLADRKIYQFRNLLSQAGLGRNYLLYAGYDVATYKGMAASYTAAGNAVTLHHRFFYAALYDTNPALQDLVGSGYLATFDLMNRAQAPVAANGSHIIGLLDYITLPAGAVANVGDNLGTEIAVTLFWNAQDVELYMNLQIPVTVTLNGVSRYFTLNVTESIVPGTLLAGSGAAIKTVGTRTRDVLDASLSITGTPVRLRVSNLYDFNNPSYAPGVMVGKGELVRASACKYGVRLKRYATAYANVGAWLLDNNRPVVDAMLAGAEFYTPARHNSFSALPERIIPFRHGNSDTRYLVYGLDPSTGKFSWKEQYWLDNSLVSTESGGRFGITLPYDAEEVTTLATLPSGLSIYGNKNGVGASLSAMVFTTQNGFKGYDSIVYNNKVLTLGNVIQLSPTSLIALQASAGNVQTRARAANPGVPDAARMSQVQVYTLTANKAVVVITDGVCYAEAGIVSYGVSGSNFVIDLLPTNGLKLTPVTAGGIAVSGTSRESKSADGVWMSYSDMVSVLKGANAYDIAITRPFGDLYGDISFSVSNILSTGPVVTPGRLNPGKLYNGTKAIDAVDQIYPPLLIPNKGIYQTDPGNTSYSSDMIEVAGTLRVDLHNINEAGWVRVPAGGRAVIGGRTFIFEKDYAVKVNTSGTTYCYLVRQGDDLIALGSDVMRDPNGSEVLFGTAVNGILNVNRHYIVMDNHIITPMRRGSAIPCFVDDGANGINQFFTQRDVG